MKKGLLLLLGVILIGILSYLCFIDKMESIKGDLLSKSKLAYKDKQFDWVDVDIQGQNLEMTTNLVLRGVAPSEEKRDEAELIAKSIEGVMGVDNRLTLALAPQSLELSIKLPKVAELVATKVSPYTIAVTKEKSNQIILTGYVENIEEHNRLVAKAITLFGAENITDELKEATGSPTAWYASAELGLDKLKVVDYGQFNITDRVFNFKGYVGTEATKEVVLANLKESLNSDYEGTYTIDAPSVTELATTEVSPYTIAVTKEKSNQIILTGYVENIEEHNRLVAKAITLFGAENITDELKEATGSPTAWYASAELGLDKLKVVDYGQFNITDRVFNFKGYVGTEATKEVVLANLKESLNSDYEGTYTIDAPVVKVVELEEVITEVVEEEVLEEVKIPKSISCQASFTELLANKKIHFEYDKAFIKKSSYELLDSLISVANGCPNSKIEIEGHTDSDGSKQYNQKLSYRRADAVKVYLIQRGIQSDRLKAIGYGEINPVATNKTKDGKEQNRRIEFNVKGAE